MACAVNRRRVILSYDFARPVGRMVRSAIAYSVRAISIGSPLSTSLADSRTEPRRWRRTLPRSFDRRPLLVAHKSLSTYSIPAPASTSMAPIATTIGFQSGTSASERPSCMTLMLLRADLGLCRPDPMRYKPNHDQKSE